MLSILLQHKLFFLTVFILSFIIGILAFPTHREDGATKSLLSDGVGYINDVLDRGPGRFIKQTDGYTTFLIMGIDSRDLEFDGTSFKGKDRNIDVIMQVIYDHKQNNIFLVSIPRDTGYAITEECTEQSFDKAINRLYRYGEDGNCEGGGISLMQEYTEKITGFHNDYYALVSFDTFYDFIEEIAEEQNGEKGLWIDVPETIYELYPTETGFESVSFKKGRQFMNSHTLLKYARSRKNSSDFARARRQQLIIEAVKQRMLSLEMIQDPARLKSALDTFRNNALYSQITLPEIVSAVSLLTKIQNAEIYKIVLDNEFGGHDKLILKPSYSPPYVGHYRSGFYLTPRHYNDKCCTLDEFLKVKEHLKAIIENPVRLEEDYLD